MENGGLSQTGYCRGQCIPPLLLERNFFTDQWSHFHRPTSHVEADSRWAPSGSSAGTTTSHVMNSSIVVWWRMGVLWNLWNAQERVIPPRWSCKPMCGKPLLQIYVVDDPALLLSRKPCFVQWRPWGEWYLTTSDSHSLETGQCLTGTYQTESGWVSALELEVHMPDRDHDTVAITRSLKPEVFPWLRMGLLDRGRIYLLLYLYHQLPFSSTTYLMAHLFTTSPLLFILLSILISYITQLFLRTVLKPYLFFPCTSGVVLLCAVTEVSYSFTYVLVT